MTGKTDPDPRHNAARLRIRVLRPSGGHIGPGMVTLLKAVESEGSISGAARSLGMSYRRAWLLLDQAKDALGAAVVETNNGGAEKGGAKLSDSGARLVAIYDRIEAGANAAVSAELRELCGAGP